jgi:hypothetical protein
MTEPHADPEPPRPPGVPDLEVELPVDERGDDQPGNVPAADDVDADAGTMEPPD